MTKQESIDYMFAHIGRFDEAMKKLAAGEEMLSGKWIIYYGAVLAFLFVYAHANSQVACLFLQIAFAGKGQQLLCGIHCVRHDLTEKDVVV